MDLSQLVGGAVSIYLTLLAGAAAITATQAMEEDDRLQMGRRVTRTITWGTAGVGLPLLIAGLVAINVMAKGEGAATIGLMSVVIGLGAFLGLIALWTGSVLMGALATKVAQNLAPLPGGLVVFFFCSMGAPLGLLTLLVQHRAHL